MPAGASLLKSQFAAAEKNVIVNVTLHSNLLLHFNRVLQSLHHCWHCWHTHHQYLWCSPMKDSEAPSPIHIGKTKAQKCEMASITQEANTRGRTEPFPPHAFFSSVQHKLILLIKSLQFSQCLLRAGFRVYHPAETLTQGLKAINSVWQDRKSVV